MPALIVITFLLIALLVTFFVIKNVKAKKLQTNQATSETTVVENSTNLITAEKTKKEKNSKFDLFFDKFGLYIIVSVVIGAIFLICYKSATLTSGNTTYPTPVFPFGSNTISTYDYYFQIVEFTEHLFGFFNGDNSLFYSRNMMGGADMFQSLCFMFVSPFTLLTLLFGPGNFHIAFNFILPLKLMTIGCVAVYFIRKRFPKIDSISTFFIALTYALCGYTITAHTYIVWLDLLIYFPFVVLGFKKLVETGSVKMHAIASALMIYCSFSISSFAHFIIYPIYFIYVLMMVDKDKRKKVFTNVFISLVYMVLMALPILLPTLISSSNSTRTTSLFGNLDNDIRINVRQFYIKLTYIITDSIPLILGIIYLIKNRKDKFAKFLIVAGLIIFIPVLIDESCLLLNMGSYNSYALRFGFLNSFFSLFTCCLFLEKITSKDWLPQGVEVIKEANTAQEDTTLVPPTEQTETPVAVTAEKDNSKDKAEQGEMSVKDAFNSMGIVKLVKNNFKNKKLIITIIATLVLALITVFFTLKLQDLFDISDTLVNEKDNWRDENGGFLSYFSHSEGGFNVIAWILVFALIIVGVGLLLVKYKAISVKILCCMLALFTIGQTSFYAGAITGGDLQTHNGAVESFKAFANALEQEKLTNITVNGNLTAISDYDYYRIKDGGWCDNTKEGHIHTYDCSKLHTGNNNISLSTDAKMLDVFSSNVDKRSFKVSDYFNYTRSYDPHDNMYDGAVHHVNVLGDSFLGYKYVFLADVQMTDDSTYFQKMPYYNKTEINLTFDELKDINYSKYGFYENTLAMPLCFYTTSDTPLDMKGVNYCRDMENLYKFLGGEGNLFKSYPLSNAGNGEITFNKEERYIYIQPKKQLSEGEYYVDFDFNTPVTELYSQNGYDEWQLHYNCYNKNHYRKDTSNYLYSIKIFYNDELMALSEEEIKSKISVKVVDIDNLKQLATKAKERIITFTQTRDGVKFNLDTSKITLNPNENVYVYLSNPYLDTGSFLKVNGKTVNPIKNPTGLTIFKLGNSGTYNVKTGYLSCYFIISLVTLVVSIGLIIGLTLLRRKTKLFGNEKVQSVIYYAGFILALALICFFFIYPTTLTIKKAFLKTRLFRFFDTI